MRHFVHLTASGAMLAALAACNSGNSGTGSAPQTTRHFAADAGVAAKALNDGKTLTAQKGGTATYEIDWNTGTTTLRSGDTFSVAKNASGELTMTVNGREFAFSPGDRFVDSDGMVYSYDVQSPSTSVWLYLGSYTGTLDETLDPNGTDYAQIWGYYVDADQNGIASQAYSVVGTETRAADLALLPSATYSGRTRMDVIPATGYSGGSSSRTRVRSDLSMAADFGAGTIGGSLTNITVEPPGGSQSAVAGTISMDQATLSGNGFASTLTPDAAFITGQGAGWTGSGNYAVKFFGPAADQVAGTMTMTGTNSSGAWNGVGYFIAD